MRLKNSVGCFHVLKLNELRKSKILPDISLLLFFLVILNHLKVPLQNPKIDNPQNKTTTQFSCYMIATV